MSSGPTWTPTCSWDQARPETPPATRPRHAVRDGDRVITFHEESLARLTAQTRGLPVLVLRDGEWVEET